MNCGNCGEARLDASQRFCGRCGTRLSEGRVPANLAVPSDAAASARTSPVLTRTEPAHGAVTPFAPLDITRICPVCGPARVTKTFGFWHILATIVFFPFGALVFLAPIEVCERGHRFGLGRPVVTGIKILTALTLVAGLALGAVLTQALHAVTHALGG